MNLAFSSFWFISSQNEQTPFKGVHLHQAEQKNVQKAKELLVEDLSCDWSKYRKTIARLRANRSHTVMFAANLLADFYAFSEEIKKESIPVFLLLSKYEA